MVGMLPRSAALPQAMQMARLGAVPEMAFVNA
jgi:hypothetical protein